MTARRLAVAALIASPLVGIGIQPTLATADTPPPTSTDPVSTVSTVTTPATTPVPVPKPDPAPVTTVVQRPHAHVAAKPRAAPVVEPAPAPAAAPPAVAPAPVRVAVPVHHSHPAVKRRTHRAVHRPKRARHHAAPAVPPVSRKAPVRPRTHRPAVIAVSVSSQGGGGRRWLLPGAFAGIALLLGAAVGVVAGRRTRRAAPATADPVATAPVQPVPPVIRRVAPPSAVERPAPPPPLLVEPVAPEERTCRIEWWRGYVRSQFLAFADGDTPIASSASFAWRSKDPPTERDDAVDALAGLVRTLTELGWVPDGRGEHWFSLRFAEAGAPGIETAEDTNFGVRLT